MVWSVTVNGETPGWIWVHGTIIRIRLIDPT